MTGPERFRSLALALPETVEGEHQGTANLRVRNRIFATLPSTTVGVVELPLDAQAALLASEPGIYEPAGGWGRHGWPRIQLAAAGPDEVGEALVDAWRTVAPKELVRAFEAGR